MRVEEEHDEADKPRRAAEKRKAVAEWIQATTGAAVPHQSDKAFRAALADGVVLVHLLNALRPGTIARVMERGVASPTGQVIRAFENVANFLEAVERLNAHAGFSAADLEDEGERPNVAECLLALRDWQSAATHSSGGGSRRSSLSPALYPAPAFDSPPAGPQPSPGAHAAPFSFTPQAEQLVGRSSAAGLDAADGLAYLMRSCTHMLKTRMGMPATPLPAHPPSLSQPDAAASEIAVAAVAPVLEGMITHLTSEYEKRLRGKDQEHRMQADAVRALQRQVAALEAEVTHWKAAADGAAAAAASKATEKAEALKAQERAEYERLRQAEASLLCELSSKRRELAEVEADAGRRCAVADAELAALRSEVGQYRELHMQYKAVQEENRALYNTVQDLRGSIRVFCRVRPRAATGDDSACVVEPGEEGALAVYSHKHSKWHEFKFDRVFGEGSTQEEVYEETKPLVRSVLDGYNVCIFAYGQTGSGKTHTMSGSDAAVPGGAGVNHRALGDLFALREARRGEVEYVIRVQLLEIYNEALRDLLAAPEGGGGGVRVDRPSLALNATRGSGCNVPDATQLEVGGAADLAALMARGARNRAVAETAMNDRSSRSHQVLTVMVEGVNRLTQARTRGCLHLIDLAGSERVGRSGAAGQQLVEAQHINRSLSALGGVMAALAAKRDHVPFRDSKLTQLLADSLAGQAKSMMFVHVAPEMNSASETLSTLNFGKSVAEITLGAAKRNADSGALFEARDALGRAQREASAAAAELDGERRRAAELERQLDAARRELAAAKAGRDEGRDAPKTSAPPASGGGGDDAIRAYRPGLDPGGSSSSTSSPSPASGLSRPPHVARLNLSALGGAHSTHSTPPRDGSASARIRSKIPTPGSGGPLSRSGSLTARPAAAPHKPSPLSGNSAAGSLSGVGGSLAARQQPGSGERHATLAVAAAHSVLPRARSGLGGGGAGGGAAPASAREPGQGGGAARRWA